MQEGIEKNKNVNLERADIDRVKEAVKKVASKTDSMNADSAADGCGCNFCC